MFIVNNPYAVYTFIKLKGIMEFEAVIMPIQEKGWPWADIVQQYDPDNLNLLPHCIKKNKMIEEKLKEGWKLASWQIAYLSPDENKPGKYEDKINITIYEH